INIQHQCWAHPVVNIEVLVATAIFLSMQETMNFVAKLKNVSLNDSVSKLNEDAIEWLSNPPSQPISIENPGMQFSISAYLALESTSQNAYNRVCPVARSSFASSPGANNILSFYSVKKLIVSYTGVVSIEHDMCCNTCIAYTSPFSQLEVCPMCEVLTGRRNSCRAIMDDPQLLLRCSPQFQSGLSCRLSTGTKTVLSTWTICIDVHRRSFGVTGDREYPCHRQCCDGVGLPQCHSRQ
ncbi:hypothetical protein M404DRAFT_142520, partial [Pisolithus tinctorius Marx 270]